MPVGTSVGSFTAVSGTLAGKDLVIELTLAGTDRHSLRVSGGAQRVLSYVVENSMPLQLSLGPDCISLVIRPFARARAYL